MKIRIFKKSEGGDFEQEQILRSYKAFKSWICLEYCMNIIDFGPEGNLQVGSWLDAFDYFKKNGAMIMKPDNKNVYSIDRRG